jgi:hypothetical protein
MRDPHIFLFWPYKCPFSRILYAFLVFSTLAIRPVHHNLHFNTQSASPVILGFKYDLSRSWSALFLGDINTGTWLSRLGGLESESVKSDHESRGTRT